MKRLNQERQNRLEPVRMKKAVEELEKLGYGLIKKTDKEIQTIHNGERVSFFPYSGWATGKSIKDGRGLKHLLEQLKPNYSGEGGDGSTFIELEDKF